MTFIPSLDPHRIMRCFHGAFATGVASQHGMLTLPDTWFCLPFWDLLVLQLLRPDSSNLPCLYSTFRLEYPLVFSRFCSFILFCDILHKISFKIVTIFKGVAMLQLFSSLFADQEVRVRSRFSPLRFQRFGILLSKSQYDQKID